ncbi:hypothetical protein OB986_20380 [Bacillus cereus]|nr:MULTISPECIES: hypothetical protein [Bacillus cereus group]EKS7870937.1 hypothetical protein [Bacillus cereus]MBE4939692.1 hypothetical protein [Bacillus thuringiensis]MCU5063581.1 hypothetical protein [Bacillus cereus]PFS47116.1 hypothetical protein COK44_17250 [Bacillus cereus]
MNYGWAGTIEQFKKLDVQFFVKQLLDHVYKTNTNNPKIDSQKRAWIDSYIELPPLSLRLEVRDS